MSRRSWILAVLVALSAALPGCDRVYYGSMKKFGYEKRDILISRVRDARKAQDEAQQEFKSALDRFREVVSVEGGALEDKYEKLDDHLQRAEARARKVHDRVKSVRDVSDDLFKEWQKELSKYEDRQLRAESERELRETRRRTQALIAAMQKVEKRIDPVLQPLRDRVLFLKHNLNAKALGALTRELSEVESHVDSLVADMQQSIAEADTFLAEMEREQRAGETRP